MSSILQTYYFGLNKYFKMFLFFICGILLSTIANVVCYKSDYERIPGGWIKPHKVAATWMEAVEQCHAEGAILASPINEDILNKMISIINANGHKTPYYIGNNANIQPGLYVSLEGVPLNNMPAIDMVEVLDPTRGSCLTIDHSTMRVVDCTSRWPFFCYRAFDENLNVTECGTFDKEYKLLATTGSCYKLHSVKVKWAEAYATCIHEGGYLAIINNRSEAFDVSDLIWKQYKLTAKAVYIGLLEFKLGGPWFSVHWDPFETIYNSGIPSDLTSHIKSCKYHRGTIKQSGSLYLINDKDDKEKYPFLCERDPAYVRFPLRETVQHSKYNKN